MHSKKAAVRTVWLWLPAAAVAVIALCFLPSVNALYVGGLKKGVPCFYSHSAYKNGFSISYTHSVNKGRVHDYYFINKKNNLVLEKTDFVSYGAGIPEPEETPGAVFTVLDDGYEISGLNREVPRLYMAVGLIARHSITIDDREFLLTDFFEPQTSLILEARRISFAEYILKRLK